MLINASPSRIFTEVSYDFLFLLCKESIAHKKTFNLPDKCNGEFIIEKWFFHFFNLSFIGDRKLKPARYSFEQIYAFSSRVWQSLWKCLHRFDFFKVALGKKSWKIRYFKIYSDSLIKNLSYIYDKFWAIMTLFKVILGCYRSAPSNFTLVNF